MTKEEAEIKIKASAYMVAAELGVTEAVKLLQKIANELKDTQWQGSGNR